MNGVALRRMVVLVLVAILSVTGTTVAAGTFVDGAHAKGMVIPDV